MNETTNLNSELLSADARGRKHIPFAVFAVILIHVILFLFLLVAAGCRAKARARRNARPNADLLAQKAAGPALAPTNAPASVQSAPAAEQPPVVVTEPAVEQRAAEPAAAPVRKAAQKASPRNSRRASIATVKGRIYTVKAGDTVEKIARMHRTSVEAIKTENKLKDHFLRPGQQLRVSTQKQKSADEA